MDLSQHTGSTQFFKSMLSNVIYTEGVKDLCDQGFAWMLDVVVSHAPHYPKDDYICFAEFEQLPDRAGKFTLHDGRDPRKIYVTQKFPFADLPASTFGLFVEHDGSRWTVLLPSEH